MRDFLTVLLRMCTSLKLTYSVGDLQRHILKLQPQGWVSLWTSNAFCILETQKDKQLEKVVLWVTKYSTGLRWTLFSSLLPVLLQCSSNSWGHRNVTEVGSLKSLPSRSCTALVIVQIECRRAESCSADDIHYSSTGSFLSFLVSTVRGTDIGARLAVTGRSQ